MNQPTKKPILAFTWTQVFPEPKSLEEAHARREDLLAEMREIQAQLSNKFRLGVDGQPLSPVEYRKWRSKSVPALMSKTSLARLLYLWIRKREREVARSGPEAGILSDAVVLFDRLREEGVELDKDEVKLVERMRVIAQAVKGKVA